MLEPELRSKFLKSNISMEFSGPERGGNGNVGKSHVRQGDEG